MDHREWNSNGEEPSSPLRSMSNTTDTLSVKQTHIGVDHCHENYPDNFKMIQEYSKSALSSSGNYEVNELVQYPPDIISTTVERSNISNWGYQSGEAILKYKSHHHQRYGHSKSKLKKLPFEDVNDSLQCHNDYPVNNFQECDTFSNAESCSDGGSTISGTSGFTGIESVAGMMKKVNYEVNNVGTQSQSIDMINEYVQTSFVEDNGTGEVFELKRANAGLKGQLEQFDYIVEEMVKERSHFQMKIHSLEKELKVNNDQIQETIGQKDHLSAVNEELKLSINKWESIVNDYQEVIEAKSNEIKVCNEDINHMSGEYEKLKIMCEHLKIDFESKCNNIKEMEKKINQMTLEFKSVIQSKINIDEDIKKLKNENDTLIARKEWNDEEMNKMNVRLNELQQKLVSEHEETLNAKSLSEKCQIENSILKQQLVRVKHNAVKEKEILMKHLEGIGADLWEREYESKYQQISQNESMSLLQSNRDSVKHLNEGMREKDQELESLTHELKQYKESNEQYSNEIQSYINEITNLKKQINEKDFEVNSSIAYKSDLELKVKGLNIDLKRQRELNELLRRDKKESDNKLASLSYDNKTLESATRQLKETIEKYERDMKLLKSNLVAKETKLDLIEREKSKFNDIIYMKDQELSQIKQSLVDLKDDDNQMNMREVQIQKNELENVMNALNTELRSLHNKHETEKNKLINDISELQIKLSEEQKYRDTNQQKIYDLNIEKDYLISELQLSKNKSDDLQMLLKEKETVNGEKEINDRTEYINNIMRAKDEKIRVLESNIKLLTRKYKEIKIKNDIELKTESVYPKVSIFNVSTQTDGVNQNENIIEDLTRDVIRYQKLLKDKESIIEENMKIILNLEHEKGKLMSADDNGTKQHINSLETLITEKTDEVTELNAKLHESINRYKDFENKMNKKLGEIENDLKKEKAIVKDLRHTIFTEKRENSYHKRDMNDLKKMLNDANVIADKRKQEVIDIENAMKSQKDIEYSLRNEIEKINSDLKYAKEENVKLKIQIEESSTKSEPLLDQLKSLSLNLMEKNQEINSIKSMSSATQQRYEIELQGLKQRIEDYISDNQSINEKLIELRKEKFSVQSKMTELRVALKNSHELNKRLKDQMKNCENAFSHESTFNEELINQLLSQSYQTTMESGPLLNLQACVESLKQEMEVLQKQITN